MTVRARLKEMIESDVIPAKRFDFSLTDDQKIFMVENRKTIVTEPANLLDDVLGSQMAAKYRTLGRPDQFENFEETWKKYLYCDARNMDRIICMMSWNVEATIWFFHNLALNPVLGACTTGGRHRDLARTRVLENFKQSEHFDVNIYSGFHEEHAMCFHVLSGITYRENVLLARGLNGMRRDGGSKKIHSNEAVTSWRNICRTRLYLFFGNVNIYLTMVVCSLSFSIQSSIIRIIDA